MRGREAAPGSAGPASRARRPSRSTQDNMYLRAGAPVRGRGRASTTRASATTPCGPSTTTSSCRRRSTAQWWNTYRDGQPPLRRGRRPRSPPRAPRSGCTTTSCSWCRRWSASCGPTCGSAGSTTSPSRRSSCSPSCPGAARWSRGCSGADFLGFQRTADAENFLRACRRLLGMTTKGDTVVVHPLRLGRAGSARSGRAPSRSRWTSAAWTSSPAPRRSSPGPAEIRASLGDPRGPHAGRRPARLHQGHPAPAQGLRGAAARQGARPAGRDAGAGCDARAGSASTPTASCATRSSATVGRINGEYADIGSTAVHYLHHSLPPRGDGGPVPGRRRHARDAPARRHEPRRQGVRHLPHRPRRRPGPVRVRRRLARAAPGLRLQPARHRGPEADDHARDQHPRARTSPADEGAAARASPTTTCSGGPSATSRRSRWPPASRSVRGCSRTSAEQTGRSEDRANRPWRTSPRRRTS